MEGRDDGAGFRADNPNLKTPNFKFKELKTTLFLAKDVNRQGTYYRRSTPPPNDIGVHLSTKDYHLYIRKDETAGFRRTNQTSRLITTPNFEPSSKDFKKNFVSRRTLFHGTTVPGM
jgi:hypothetical protein